MELLTKDNQFYYNQTSMELSVLTKQTLTEKMAVLLPQNIEILTVNGTSSNAKVKRMRFEGLTIQFSKPDFSVCLSGTCTGFAGGCNTATVRTMNVDDVVFDGVNITDTGGYGIWFDQGSYDCKFINGLVSNSASGGIRIGANKGTNIFFFSHDAVYSEKTCYYKFLP